LQKVKHLTQHDLYILKSRFFACMNSNFQTRFLTIGLKSEIYYFVTDFLLLSKTFLMILPVRDATTAVQVTSVPWVEYTLKRVLRHLLNNFYNQQDIKKIPPKHLNDVQYTGWILTMISAIFHHHCTFCIFFFFLCFCFCFVVVVFIAFY